MTLPEELKELQGLNQWVVATLAVKPDGKLDKTPIDPRTGYNAKADDPSTWSDFETANQAVESGRYKTLGFEFANGIMGIDLDHVVIDGQLTPEALDIIKIMDSYTELSPSGTGVHILFKGKLIEGMSNRTKKGSPIDAEVYDTGRYFTLTGRKSKNGRGIEERQNELTQVYLKYFNTVKLEASKGGGTGARVQLTESDSELWRKMFNSAKGAEIQKLYNGDCGDFGNDHSKADLALCNHLAYWCNLDEQRIDSMFRQSGLMRDKWDKRHSRDGATYGQITISEAVAGKSAYCGYTDEEKKAYAKRKQAEQANKYGNRSKQSNKSNTSKSNLLNIIKRG